MRIKNPIKCTSNRTQLDQITVGESYRYISVDLLAGAFEIIGNEGWPLWVSARNFEVEYE